MLFIVNSMNSLLFSIAKEAHPEIIDIRKKTTFGNYKKVSMIMNKFLKNHQIIIVKQVKN